MRKNFVKLGAGFAAVAALALGGSALASAGTHATPPAPPAATGQSTSNIDTEVNAVTEQSGTAADPDTLQDDPAGKPDIETKDAAGTADSAADTASELASETAASDGPGGHADEPGNPGADHQAVGQE